MKENEYLKAVLSNRNEIQTNKLEDDNKKLRDHAVELERKNTQLVDEINDLYEERQTLITSLLNLNSEEVDEVVRIRSRSSSVASRESLDDRWRVENEELENRLKTLEEELLKGNHDLQSCEQVCMFSYIYITPSV